MITRSPIITGSTGPIFAIFAPNDRYLFVDDRSGPLFPIPQGTLLWQAIFGKIGKMTFIQQAFRSETGRNMAVPIKKYSMAIL